MSGVRTSQSDASSDMDLVRAPRRTTRKKGSGYENGFHFTKTKIIATSSTGSGPTSYPGYYLCSPPASGQGLSLRDFATDLENN